MNPQPSSTGLSPNVAAGLSYFVGWVTGLVFFLLEKTNSFVRFHAAQSIILFGGLTVVGIFVGIAHFIPIIEWFAVPVGSLLGLVNFVLWIVCMVQGFQNKFFKLPVVGDMALKLSGLKGDEFAAPAAAAVPSDPAAPPPSAAQPPPPQPVAASGGNKAILILALVGGAFVLCCGGIPMALYFMASTFVKVDDNSAKIWIPGAGKIGVSTDPKEIEAMQNLPPLEAKLDDVKALVPEALGDWKRAPKLEDAAKVEGSAHVRGTYRNEDKQVTLQLFGGTSYMHLAGGLVMWLEVETDDMRSRRITHSGYKGMELRDHKGKDATVALRVGKFLVVAGRSDGDDPSPLYEFLQDLDLAAIEGVK
jgi:uncharacterized membrane protein